MYSFFLNIPSSNTSDKLQLTPAFCKTDQFSSFSFHCYSIKTNKQTKTSYNSKNFGGG